MHKSLTSTTQFIFRNSTLILLFAVLWAINTHAQVENDSLKAIWSNTKLPDKDRLEAIDAVPIEKLLRKNPDEALGIIAIQFEIAEKSGEQTAMAEALYGKGQYFYYQTNYPEAIDYFTQSITLSEAIDYPAGTTKSYNALGRVYWRMGKHDKALEIQYKCLSIFNSYEDSTGLRNPLLDIGNMYYISGEYHKALEAYQSYLEYSKNENNDEIIAGAHLSIGGIHWTLGNYDDAFAHAKKALEVSERSDHDWNIAASLNLLGEISKIQSDYINAINYFTKSLLKMEEVGDKEAQSIFLHNIANIHMEQKDYENALVYYNKSLEIAIETKDFYGQALTLGNIGKLYLEQGKIDAAINTIKESKRIAEDIDVKDFLSLSLIYLGEAYAAQNKDGLALEAFERSLKIQENLGVKEDMSETLTLMGQIYKKQGVYTKALSLGKRAYKISKEIGVVEQMRNSSGLLYELYKKKSNYKKALAYSDIYHKLNDSIVNDENYREVIRQKFDYEYEAQARVDSISFAKEREAQANLIKIKDLEIEKSNLVKNASIFGAIALLLIALFIYSRMRVIRKQNSIIDAQNKSIEASMLELRGRDLRARMDPHFIFNCLNSLQNAVFLKKEKEANAYFGSFSKLLRATLDMGAGEDISLKDELSYLKSYISLEKVRLNNDLDVSFDIDPDLDLSNTKIPCMFFQPIVENAIIHGLKPKQADRKLKISFKKQDDSFIGTVEDNGVGRHMEAQEVKKKNKRKSWATVIIKERIEILNRQNRKVALKIIDLVDQNQPKGTKVVLKTAI